MVEAFGAAGGDLTNIWMCGINAQCLAGVGPAGPGRSEMVEMTTNLYLIPAAAVIVLVLVELLSIKERLAVGRVKV
jgi:hypothetical protein